jgi:hypothetical protein
MNIFSVSFVQFCEHGGTIRQKDEEKRKSEE